MSRYRKVEVRVWTDEAFRALSPAPPNGQTLWLYMLTGPRTIAIPGVVIGREAVMADDLGWPIEGFRKAFAEAAREGLLEADLKAGLVVLKKALFDSSGEPRKTTKPESPNVIKSWIKAWDEIPECHLKMDLLHRLHTYSSAIGKSFAKAFTEAFAKPLGKASAKEGATLPVIRRQETGDRRQESDCDPPGEPAAVQPEVAPLRLVPEEAPVCPESRSRKSRVVPLPPGWEPAVVSPPEGVDATFELAKFRDWATANGRRYVDWQAAWRNWLRNATPRRPPGGNGPLPPTDAPRKLNRL